MLWQGAKWRILKNFNVQNEECHNYDLQITILMKGRIDGRKLGQRSKLVQLWIKKMLLNYGSY